MNSGESEDDELVNLCSCQYELEAQSLRALLADAGITAVVQSSPFSALSSVHVPGSEVALRVPRHQLEQAKQTIEVSRIHAAAIDWDEVDLGEMPEEVEDLLQQREVIHGFSRVLAIAGIVLGFMILLICLIAVLVMSLN